MPMFYIKMSTQRTSKRAGGTFNDVQPNSKSPILGKENLVSILGNHNFCEVDLQMDTLKTRTQTYLSNLDTLPRQVEKQ